MNPFLQILSLMFLCSGCAIHVQGLISSDGVGAKISQFSGKTNRLLTGGDSAPLSHIDGPTVEIWGQQMFGAIRVKDWKVREGNHGMPTWVGTLEFLGSRLGVMDRNSGGFYVFDDNSTKALRPHVGLPVLVEGFVDGPHQVRVLHWEVLDGSGTNGAITP